MQQQPPPSAATMAASLAPVVVSDSAAVAVGTPSTSIGLESAAAPPSDASSGPSASPPGPSQPPPPQPQQTVVLITSCLQNDFFHRFPRRRDSMNRYWVGRKDSERVLGFDPNRGPLAQIMNFIRGRAATTSAAAPVAATPTPHEATSVRSPIAHETAAAYRELVAAALSSETDSRASAGSGLLDASPAAPLTGVDGLAPLHRASHSETDFAFAEQLATEQLADLEEFGNYEVEEAEESALAPVGASAADQRHALRIDSLSAAATQSPVLSTTTPFGMATLSPRVAHSNHLAHETPHLLLPPAAAAAMASVPGVAAIPVVPSSHSSTPIHVIHLRASIDHTKNRGRQAIERYGEYCIAGTDGAKLCCDLEETIDRYPTECIIDTTRTLTSNSYRPLLKKLREIAGTRGGPLRVAVIGGWTDEDVYHLCYELRTRTKAIDIATCSVLTASPSTSQHWNALGQMKRIMGVTVTRTVRELVQWFNVGGNSAYHTSLISQPSSEKYWPTFIWNLHGQPTHTPPKEFRPESDGEILAHLYRNSSRIIIDILSGDFTRAVVLSIRSYDKAQVREAPSVLKIAASEDIATEYQAFHRVEEMLGNNAPAVRGFVELGTRAGIKFRYTRMTGGKVCSMADLFNDLSLQSATIHAALDEVFQEIFNPWYAASRLEFFDLFSYYFDGYTLSLGRVWGRVKKVDRVHCDATYLQQLITYCLTRKGTDPAPKQDSQIYQCVPYTEATFRFPLCDHDPFTNLGVLFEKPSGVPYLRTLPPQKLYSCFAHGNATLENFMCEGSTASSHSHGQQSTSHSTSSPGSSSSISGGHGSSGNNGNGGSGGVRGNVWIVDYYFCESRNHCLRDLARTWCCIMYQATEITTDQQFAQSILISSEMARARDLAVPLNTFLVGLTDIHLRTIFTLLGSLWQHAGRIVRDRSSASQFQLALLADSMRFFLYRTKNIYSKRWALATSVLLLESILLQEKRTHDIKPAWISLSENSQLASQVKGKLGITRCPGHRDFLRFEKKTHTLQDHQLFAVEPPILQLEAERATPELRLSPLLPTRDVAFIDAASSSSALAAPRLLLSAASSPLVRAARYSATNPSLLPPNEDRRREEQKEREQVIADQQARDDEEEEARVRDGQQETIPSESSVAAPPPSTDAHANGASAMVGEVAPATPAEASLGAPTSPSASQQRTKRKQAEVEQKRAVEFARVMSEQEIESARYAQSQPRNRGLEGDANNNSDAIGDAEIEAEMLAAVEVDRERQRERERATSMQLQQSPVPTATSELPVGVTTSPLVPLPAPALLDSSFFPPLSSTPVSSAATAAVVSSPGRVVEPASSYLPGVTPSLGGSSSGASAPSSSLAQVTRVQSEVARLAREGTTHILLLLSDSDFKEMGVDQVQLESAIRAHGMKQLRVIVPPGPLLPLALLIDLVQVSLSVLCDPTGEHKLLLISKSGFHRAGTLAACILCAFGLPVDRSIRVVRDARGSRSLGRESRDQLVSKFDDAFKKYLIEKVLQKSTFLRHGGADSANGSVSLSPGVLFRATAATPTPTPFASVHRQQSGPTLDASSSQLSQVDAGRPASTNFRPGVWPSPVEIGPLCGVPASSQSFLPSPSPSPLSGPTRPPIAPAHARARALMLAAATNAPSATTPGVAFTETPPMSHRSLLTIWPAAPQEQPTL